MVKTFGSISLHEDYSSCLQSKNRLQNPTKITGGKAALIKYQATAGGNVPEFQHWQGTQLQLQV